MAKHPFHLAWFLSQGFGPRSWRSTWPGADVGRWMMPDLFIDLAKRMERACMEPNTYQGRHDTYLKYTASTPKLDPAVLVPYCKRRRENPSLKRPESLVAPEQKCLGR